MTITYMRVVEQHVEDCEVLNLDKSELAFSIILSAEGFHDHEVEATIKSLPKDIFDEIFSMIENYRETGKFYAISSTGTTKDLSDLLGRISTLV